MTPNNVGCDHLGWPNIHEQQVHHLMEYMRDACPVGSMVRPAHPRGCLINAKTSNTTTVSASTHSSALVVGIRDHYRYLLLHTPWVDKTGFVIQFCEAQVAELSEVFINE